MKDLIHKINLTMERRMKVFCLTKNEENSCVVHCHFKWNEIDTIDTSEIFNYVQYTNQLKSNIHFCVMSQYFQGRITLKLHLSLYREIICVQFVSGKFIDK